MQVCKSLNIMKVFLSTVLLAAAGHLAWGCNLHARQADTTSTTDASTYPQELPGDDSPSSPITSGNFINHVCLNVRNVTESVNWYNKAFGLRLMFTLQVSEHFSISYMGHAQGGRNGTGYQTSDELNRDKNNIEGLVELINVDSPAWDLPSGMKTPNTFSHIGMVVPDLKAAQKHLEAMGANIPKGHNEDFVLEGAFADVAGLTAAADRGEISPEEWQLIEKVLYPLNTPMIFVADPDGNIIEVQEQV